MVAGARQGVSSFDATVAQLEWAGLGRYRGIVSNLTPGKTRMVRLRYVEWLPHIASVADDLCFVKSMHTDQINHAPAMTQFLTGNQIPGRPSMGAWVSYGLGSENQNMPAFVVMPDPAGWVKGGAPAWSNGYMPAAYQGTILRGGESPILNLNTPAGVSAAQQRATVDFINRLNRENLAPGDEDSDLGARIAAYELAYRMQSHAPEVVVKCDQSRISTARPSRSGDSGQRRGSGPDHHSTGTSPTNMRKSARPPPNAAGRRMRKRRTPAGMSASAVLSVPVSSTTVEIGACCTDHPSESLRHHWTRRSAECAGIVSP